jgi:Lysophospholipase L1 and related esterases
MAGNFFIINQFSFHKNNFTTIRPVLPECAYKSIKLVLMHLITIDYLLNCFSISKRDKIIVLC